MAIWTDEMKQKASAKMKAYWSDGVIRSMHSRIACKPALCPSCGETNVDKFYRDTKGRRTNSRCRECHKKHSSFLWHSKTQVEKQATRVQAMYGLTPDEYIKMYSKQQGKCAICGNKPTTKRGLHVDHNHNTKMVRGLLCHGCNTGIGAMKESLESLRSAIKYLGG
jgi:ribosomal protein S14